MRKRPALALVDHGQGDVLAVAKLDRLSRSVLDFAQLMVRPRDLGWGLVARDESPGSWFGLAALSAAGRAATQRPIATSGSHPPSRACGHRQDNYDCYARTSGALTVSANRHGYTGGSAEERELRALPQPSRPLVWR